MTPEERDMAELMRVQKFIRTGDADVIRGQRWSPTMVARVRALQAHALDVPAMTDTQLLDALPVLMETHGLFLHAMYSGGSPRGYVLYIVAPKDEPLEGDVEATPREAIRAACIRLGIT